MEIHGINAHRFCCCAERNFDEEMFGLWCFCCGVVTELDFSRFGADVFVCNSETCYEREVIGKPASNMVCEPFAFAHLPTEWCSISVQKFFRKGAVLSENFERTVNILDPVISVK